MRIKNYLFVLFLLPGLLAIAGKPVKKILKQNKTPQSMEQFVSDLMREMTIDEKIGQLNLPTSDGAVTGEMKSNGVAQMVCEGKVGAILNMKGTKDIRAMQKLAVEKSRLHIPLIFGLDVVHGYETTFPIPLAMSCSWDIPAIEKSARIAATEASADGICWTYSPMVDICHDARWGRIAEGSGEDPFLGSVIAKAMVKGYQEDFSSNTDIMACIKHFALYGAPDAGRDYNTVDMSKYRMYNEYLAPYRAAVDAGAGSIMTSFNTINGIPATANYWLLTDLLRKDWGFKGFIVTDYTAITELINHGIGDEQEVVVRSLKAGVDLDMVSCAFLNTLKKSLQEGKITEDDINSACRYVLEAKYKLGLFANPYKYVDDSRAKKDIFTSENRAVARKLATESFVLLKNDNNLLPLQRKGTIAVIGPMGNTRNNLPGCWSIASKRDSYLSVYEGLEQMAGNKATVLYAKGSNLVSDAKYEDRATIFSNKLGRDNRSDADLLKEALDVASRADVIIATLGESEAMSGESASRSQLEMLDSQHELLQALLKTGKPVVLVLFTGRPVVLTWEKANVPAILNVWFGGTETALAIGDILFGDVNPSGKLTTSFPQTVGQLPYSYNHLNTGRPMDKNSWFQKFHTGYLDVSNDMLYPFGYGLSYTTYKYGPMSLSSSTMNNNDSITASVTVQNTGKCDGDEIVQMYIKDVVATSSRPVKELKGFKRIHLNVGESKTVKFSITPDLLKYYNNKLQYVAEPGEFQVMIGPNSEDFQIQSFKLE